jgi:6-pyruvoyltetrahydropterin/6-carboxytetrahydropterin synthase
MSWLITKTIEIDAGHRIPDHNSVCRNIHGHRYRIELAISGSELQQQGSEAGMVTDFGFMKQIMIEHIHKPCDHHLMLYHQDPILIYFCPDVRMEHLTEFEKPFFAVWQSTKIGYITVCSFIPTAENLAEAWYWAVSAKVTEKLGIQPEYIRVWETPTSSATYYPGT